MVAINSFTVCAPTSCDIDPIDRTSAARKDAAHDAKLVHRFRAGDADAFTEIVSRYREKMFAVAMLQLRNRADAEEIAQDTFIRAHRALENFRGESSLSTWLHRITVNLSHNRYWYFYRRRRHMAQSLDQAFSSDNPATFAEVVACDAPGPVRNATNNEFAALVDECMEQLRPHQREILTQRNIEHCTYDQIAAALGINVGTVKSRIARARESLRGLIAKAYPEFSAEAMPPDWFEPVRPASWQPISA
jgi:RNA polymerase sigma-70 factor, ECF subfamily